MTIFQAAVLSFRILAFSLLYLALSPVAGLPMTLLAIWSRSANTSGGTSDFVFSAILHILLPGLSAAFFWFNSSWLARKILFTPFPKSEKSPGNRSLLRIPRMTVGLLVLSDPSAPALPWSLERLSIPGTAASALAVKRKGAA